MKRYKAAFLLQTGQHYKKLKDIKNLISDEFDTSYLVDGMNFTREKTFVEENNRYSLLTQYGKDGQFFPLSPAEKKYPWFLPRFALITCSYVARFFKKGPVVQTVPTVRKGWKKFVADRLSPFKKFCGRIKRPLHAWWVRLGAVAFWLKQWRKFKYFLSTTFRSLFYSEQLDRIKGFILYEKPDVLFIAEANVEYQSEAYVKKFHAAGIPVVVVPYTFCGPSEPAKYYYNSSMHRYRWYYRFVIGDKWTYEYEGRKLIRMPIMNILAMEFLGIVPPAPWIQESSNADRLIVESRAMEAHYLKHKISKQKLSSIGDISQDALFKASSNREILRSQIHQELGFKQQNDLIVFSIFPDCTAQTSDLEFPDYEASIAFICKELEQLERYNIILCLHPSLQFQDFNRFQSERIKISRRPTTELLAVADLYVASISATIRWAIALGIPVINFDVYKFRYGDYDAVPGVINMETREDFSAAIQQVNNDPQWVTQLRDKQRNVAAEWGTIDGQFNTRLKKLTYDLIEKRI